MRSPGINGEGELRGQPANPGSPGKMAVKTECMHLCMKATQHKIHNSTMYSLCMYVCYVYLIKINQSINQCMVVGSSATAGTYH